MSASAFYLPAGGSRRPKAKKGRVGFRISELCSCIGRPWPDLVRAFIKASSAAKNGNPADLKSFVCSVLAEPWRVNSDTMRNADEFLQYCDGYPAGIVPTYLPVSGLTIGIDTQDNGFYYVVRAWGGGESLESWLVECGFAEDLSGLERAVFHEYQGEDGKVYKIKGGFIDAMGHRTLISTTGVGRSAFYPKSYRQKAKEIFPVDLSFPIRLLTRTAEGNRA